MSVLGGVPALRGTLRGIKDISKDDRQLILSGLLAGQKPKDLARIFGMSLGAVYNINEIYKRQTRVPKVAVDEDKPCTIRVSVDVATMDKLRNAADRRQWTTDYLVSELLVCIINDGLVKAVLDDE